MGCIKLSIHPLFYILGAYYAITGRISLFVICSASAVIHELGHSFSALNRGYKLNKIVLMPFGAVAKGDIEGLKIIDEFAIAISGPIVNFFIAFFVVALWWIFPETYSFTENIANVNFSMFVVNLIPAYPLDGGRVLHAVIAKKAGKNKSLFICKIVGLIFGVVLLGLFIVSIFIKTNISLLIFSLFVIFGALLNEKDNVYVRVANIVDREKLRRGVEVKRYAFDYSTPLKRVVNVIDYDGLCEIEIYKNNKKHGVIESEEIEKYIVNGTIYNGIGQIYDKISK